MYQLDVANSFGFRLENLADSSTFSPLICLFITGQRSLGLTCRAPFSAPFLFSLMLALLSPPCPLLSSLWAPHQWFSGEEQRLVESEWRRFRC